MRPLHIQDWKPSAKDEGFCEDPERAGGKGMEPSSSRRRTGRLSAHVKEVLPFQPHPGGTWQGLLIQHRALGSSAAGPQLLPSVSQGLGR